MKTTIKADIYHDGEYYCAKCLNFDVFTQGKTLDELLSNLKEAVELFLESTNQSTDDYNSIMSMLEIPVGV